MELVTRTSVPAGLEREDDLARADQDGRAVAEFAEPGLGLLTSSG
jgi:hypothetical protein